jgi:hypothetical protein
MPEQFYCNFVLYFEIRECETFNIVLFKKKFVTLQLLGIPCGLEVRFFISTKKAVIILNLIL